MQSATRWQGSGGVCCCRCSATLRLQGSAARLARHAAAVLGGHIAGAPARQLFFASTALQAYRRLGGAMLGNRALDGLGPGRLEGADPSGVGWLLWPRWRSFGLGLSGPLLAGDGRGNEASAIGRGSVSSAHEREPRCAYASMEAALFELIRRRCSQMLDRL